jgi:AcrR family transcriptional regulator
MARPANAAAHEALLDAARSEFARHGIDRARVEDVARRAGVSKGAFYLHFETKEAAFQEILQRFLGALEEHARHRNEAADRFDREEDGRAGAGGDPVARRVAFERDLDVELLGILWRNRQILAAVDGAGRAAARVVAEFRRRMRELVLARMRTRRLAGALRPEVDPEAVADVVVGSYEALGRRMIEARERPDLAAWAGSLLEILYRGILQPPAPRRARAHVS